MTDQITVPRETWDALREALEQISKIDNRDWGTDWEEIEEARGIAKAALTAANAVSDQIPAVGEMVQPQGLFVDLIASHGPEFVAEMAAIEPVGINGLTEAETSASMSVMGLSKPQAPYANCRFRICDLPGQCKGEGKCHHPAVAQAQGEASKWVDVQKRTAIAQAVHAAIRKEVPGLGPWSAFDADEAQRIVDAIIHPQATEPAQPHAELLRMIATRARNFPSYPMGYHLPEVFAALGEQPPAEPEGCDKCRDPDGIPCFPQYGVGPHTCFYKIPGAKVGESQPLPKDQWPENYREDPDCPGMGVYWCTHCGSGKPTSKEKL